MTDSHTLPERGPAPDPQDFSRGPERALFARLQELALPFTNVSHEPTRTVADSRLVKTGIDGAHTKNLFMKDKRGALVLISALADTDLPLNRAHREVGVQRLSFTDAILLWQALGVTPGSVTGFALLNDPVGAVRFVLDQALFDHETWNFHPLRNDMTTSIAREDFLAFVSACGREPMVVDFARLAGEPGGEA